MKLWVLFTEKFGMPWVKATYDATSISKFYNTKPESAATLLLQQLTLMAKDGIIVFPNGTSVDIASSGQADNAEIYEKLVRICDEQNTKLQLGHSGATESTSGDKLSNDTTATDVRQNIIDSDKKFPIAFWNKLIDWVHFFNFEGNEKPHFDLYAKEDVDMSWAQRDAMLVPVFSLAGMKPTPEYLKKTYGFEDGDIEVINNIIQEEKQIISPKKSITKEKEIEEDKETKDLQYDKFKLLAHSLIHKFFNANAIEEYPDQQLIDNQADTAVDNDIFENTIVSFIAKKMENFNSYEEAEMNIPKLLSKIDTKEFEDYLAQILFAADIVGHLSLKDEVGNG
jgi:phage gp29-like protein